MPHDMILIGFTIFEDLIHRQLLSLDRTYANDE